MTDTLRKTLFEKYGGTSRLNTTTPSSNNVRSNMLKKYEPDQGGPQISEAGDALVPTKNINPVAKSTAPRALRGELTQKYSTPTEGSLVGQQKQRNIKEKSQKFGIIASPEYFSLSVDVRSPRGEFLKTYKGSEPGQAQSLAQAEADKIGGSIQVTPPAGTLGQMFVRGQEVFKGALNNYTNKVKDFVSKLDTNNKNSPVPRAAQSVDLGVASINALLSPLSAIFSAAEQIPVAGVFPKGINMIFENTGKVVDWTAGEVVDNIPFISEKTRNDIKPAVQNLSVLLSQLALGKGTQKSTQLALRKTAKIREEIKIKITKDIIETNQLPRTVFVSPESIKSIFQTGDKISAPEMQLIKGLGLSSKQYKAGIKDGINIAIPAERIITIVDKPWFAKVKGVFNIKPTSSRVVEISGKPYRGPETRESRLIEGGAPKVPKEGVIVPEAPKTVVTKAIRSPITPKLLDKIESLTPVESVAFGRTLVDSINEAVGLKIPEGAKEQLPSNIEIVEKSSSDGRPAQFKNNKIEIFLPDMLADIKKLAEGERILAHEGEFSKVYEKKQGESMEDLAVRYVRDVIMHEASHQKTMTFMDAEKIRTLQRDINSAKLTGNESKVIEFRKQMTETMREIEDRANAYMQDNKNLLEEELFGGVRKTSTEIQRQINKTTQKEISSRKKVNMTEKKVLVQKIKARAKGAREGFVEGKKEGTKKTTERLVTRYEIALNKVKERTASLESKRKDMIAYAQILPFRERGKFLKVIENARSEKDFLNVLARMRKSSNVIERATLISKIQKELKGASIKIRNGKRSAKLSADKQRIIEKIKFLQNIYEKKAKELRKAGEKEASAYNLAKSEITSIVSDWQIKNPDGVVPSEILDETELLRMVGLKDMTVNELSSVLSEIQSIIKNGKTKRELDRFNLETERLILHDNVLPMLKGGRKLPSEKMGIKQEQLATGYINKLVDAMAQGKIYLIDAWEDIGDSLSKFDKNTEPFESVLSKKMREVKNARAAEYFGNKKMINKLNESFEKVYGVKGAELMKVFAEQRKLVDLGELKIADGTTKEFSLTRGQAISYAAWFRDPRLDSTFEKAGWTPEIKQKIKSILTSEDRIMADWLVDVFYKEYWDRVNPTHILDTGTDLMFTDVYSPVLRDVETSIPENILLAQENAKYATARTGALKQRVDNTIELVPTDAFTTAIRHITRMEHYIAWQPLLNDLRSLFGNKDIRNAIREIHGKTKLKFIDEALNDFARGGVAKEKIVTKVDALRINTTIAILALNWKVATKQISGTTNYWIELDTVDFIGGIGSFWVNPIENGRFLFEKSELLAERYGVGWERDVKAAMELGYDKKIAGLQNNSELYFVMIRNMDKFTVVQGSWAAYKAGLKRGMSEKKAIEYAEDVTERTQESSALDTLSQVQRGGSWAKLFTMLQGQQVKYLRIMSNAARNIKYNRGSRTRNMKKFLMAWILQPLIYSIIANEVTGLVDKKYKKSMGELLARSVLGPVTYIPAIGSIGQAIIDRSFGDRFGYTASAAFSFVDDLIRAIDQIKSGESVGATTYIIDAMGKLRGVPTTVVTRPLRKAAKKGDGSTAPGAKVSF